MHAPSLHQGAIALCLEPSTSTWVGLLWAQPAPARRRRSRIWPRQLPNRFVHPDCLYCPWGGGGGGACNGPFPVGVNVSTNWSNTWKHACYCAFTYAFTEKHVCFHVISLLVLTFDPTGKGSIACEWFTLYMLLAIHFKMVQLWVGWLIHFMPD